MKSPVCGVLSVTKPPSASSYDVIRAIKRDALPPGTRVGHAGTLDPFATGVLLILLGDATKLSSLLMAESKDYVAEVLLGTTTDTDDATGQVVEQRPVPEFDIPGIESVLARFTGTITQVPPAYSALKQDGERLYDLARRGKEVAPRPRSVTVHRLHLAAWSPPRLAIECEVSPGTYVRALGRDIGAALGTGGTLSSLTRTRCGRFRLQDSIELARLDPQTVREAMVPPADALPALPRLTVSREDARALSQGRAVLLRSGAGDAVTALAVTSDNSFLAVATAGNGLLRTRRVICNHD